MRGGAVHVHDSLFQDLDKDGLDLDGAGGAVWVNRFVNCGDEGIDLDEAASADVFDNVVLDRRGGRIGVDDAARAANVVADNVLGYSGAGAETPSGLPSGSRRGPGGYPVVRSSTSRRPSSTPKCAAPTATTTSCGSWRRVTS